MGRLWIRSWACVSAAAMVGVVVSIPAVGQDPSQVPQETGSTAQDPFQPPPKPDADSSGKSREKPTAKKAEPEFVRKSDAEWRRILSRNEYMVTRLKETEPAFSGKYASGHYNGTFVCVCCGADLFSSRTKFESGTGWPSFWQPVGNKAVATAWDYSNPAEARVEVMCRRCGAHLGHVFEDGPPPTGLRYCINSISLKLRAPGGGSADKAAPAKAKDRSKAKSKATSRNAKQVTKSKDTSKAPGPDAPDESTPKAKPE